MQLALPPSFKTSYSCCLCALPFGGVRRQDIHLIDIRISADGWLAGSLVIEKFAVVIPSRLKCERLKPLISDGAYRRRPFVEADRSA